MPKVSEEYFSNKKEIILDAAYRVLSRKPVYSVSMKDIIKEAKLSQGGIYKYYSNIDDIIISLLNSKKINTTSKDIFNENCNNPEKVILEFLRYIKNCFLTSNENIGKIIFELYVIFLNDRERMIKFTERIDERITMNYWLKELFLYIDEKIEEKYFNPIIDTNEIYMQIIVTLRGIGAELIFSKNYNIIPKIYSYKGENKKNLSVNTDKLIERLHKSVLELLGSNNIEN